MIADSCSCCGTSGQGCKTLCRPAQPTWCPVCDRNKARRRCQSEGLYPEGDPLKELNGCCDRGCDFITHSSRHSQNKKTDLEMNDRRLLFPSDIEMESGDSYHSYNKNHPSRIQKEKYNGYQRNNHYPNFHNDSYANSGLPQMNGNPRRGSLGLDQQYRESDRCGMYVLRNDRARSSNFRYHTESRDVGLHSSKSLSFSDRDKCSAEMRERYIREMEIIRSKLNLLKDGCDGKRLRQRSESEPGFAGMTGGVPKRARDNSPKIKLTYRKLPMNPAINQSLHNFPNRQAVPFQKETKSLPPTTASLKPESDFNGLLVRGKFTDVMESSSDSELEGSTCDEELQSQEEIDANISEDDDRSVLSSLTSASSDSNTPSQVGETLGSISLSEGPKKELVDNKFLVKTSLLPTSVPMIESDVSQFTRMGKQVNLFRNSLFSNVPPYINFFMHDSKGPTLPADVNRHLKWKLSSITPIVIRRTLINSGFKLVRKSNDWTGQWGKHMKSFVFKTLKDFQKLNHFPGTFQIGRKDRLWKNLYRLMVRFGKKEFGFIPKTYILPQDSKLLRSAWEKCSNGPGKGQWIVKPPAAARGTGIKVVHKWGQIPKKRPLIVQKYIAQPYLINGSKFDLRLYVLMTSIHPLRIYLYDDGLVRFASVKYSDDVECLSDRFMHLTNYSINKLSNQYCANEDASSCQGHKWTLKTLWTYLAKEGVNVKALRKNLTDLIIKTIISGESNINILSRNNLPSRYCSYELFGIDVLLDQALKPWLLEVNISPSLHSASPLDLAVKGPLVKELFNIAGFQIPAKLSKDQESAFLDAYGLKDKTHSFCYDKRLYWTTLSKEEKMKHESHHMLSRHEYLNTILEDLTPDDVRHLIQFEDELTQLGRFEKVFPTPRTHVYHQFFESPRYYNMMLDAWETRYHNNRADGVKLLESYCQQKLHLVVPFPGGKTKSSASLSEHSARALQEAEAESESDYEKEDIEEIQKPRASAVNKPAGKSKISSKATVLSKPSVRSSYLTVRRSKSGIPSSPKSTMTGSNETVSETANEDTSLKETCFKMLAEMRQNGLKNIIPDSKPDQVKQFPNCKLENSIINEGLSNAKSVISPPKHIHNACIKMNISG